MGRDAHHRRETTRRMRDMRNGLNLRWAEVEEVEPLAQMWRAAWRDGHLGHVPEALVTQRTPELFVQRARDNLARMKVAGPVGRPLGLCIVDEDQLYQLFVAAEARGTGLAGLLLRDAETRMAEDGVRRAWLKCAVGNARAAAFYRRNGWELERTAETRFGQEVGDGIPVETWVFAKTL
ncbi:MAG: GNAT family N-acetyltransferase [Maritimibacter sp.]|nr:GNAT family N-acetyltransferase [Maritimibacter sp.]